MVYKQLVYYSVEDIVLWHIQQKNAEDCKAVLQCKFQNLNPKCWRQTDKQTDNINP